MKPTVTHPRQPTEHLVATTGVTVDVTPHQPSLAVWGFSSPIVVSRGATIKVGVKCSAGCALDDRDVEIVNDEGITVAAGRLGRTPWPGTTALHWTQLDFVAPSTEGVHTWSVRFLPEGLEVPHAAVSTTVALTTVTAPEHTATLRVVERDTQAPVDGVEVRLGVYNGKTDADGLATLEIPKGAYQVTLAKVGYERLLHAVEVSADVMLRLEIAVAVEPPEPYWM